MQPIRTTHYDVESQVCAAGDSWETLSKKAYGGVDAALALREFNRNYPLAAGKILSEGTIAPGDKVYIPPLWVLQRHGLDLSPAKPTSGAAATSTPAR
jgi:hypothetical protein